MPKHGSLLAKQGCFLLPIKNVKYEANTLLNDLAKTVCPYLS
jgi:hypothetical protein